LAAGTVKNGAKHDFLVAQYKANGTPTPPSAAEPEGSLLISAGMTYLARQIILTGGGKFAVVGTTNIDGRAFQRRGRPLQTPTEPRHHLLR